jgi:peptidylprolyl isomerase
MIRHVTAVALAGAITALPMPSRAGDDVVARIGGVEVKTGELRAYLDTLSSQDQAAVAKDSALLSQVVRSYLARQAVLREARAKRWDEDPSTKAQLDRVREEVLTELYLQSVVKPPEGFPSDAEIQAAYEANKAAFEVPAQHRVAQVFVAKGDGRDEEKARKRADELRRKVQQGAELAAVARAESDDKASAARGGEIGWVSEPQMAPAVRSAVARLAPGALSEPVRLDDGWHVLKVLESRAASTRPLGEVRDAIAAQLRAERAKANRQAYVAKLLEQNPPAINELALSGVLAKRNR